MVFTRIDEAAPAREFSFGVHIHGEGEDIYEGELYLSAKRVPLPKPTVIHDWLGNMTWSAQTRRIGRVSTAEPAAFGT